MCYLYDRKHRQHTSQVSFDLPPMLPICVRYEERFVRLCHSCCARILSLVHDRLILASNRYPERLRAIVAFLVCVWYHRWEFAHSVGFWQGPCLFYALRMKWTNVQASMAVLGFPVDSHRLPVRVVQCRPAVKETDSSLVFSDSILNLVGLLLYACV